MKTEIKCATCEVVMGTVEKEITQADLDLYRAIMTCPNGHHLANLVETIPEQPI